MFNNKLITVNEERFAELNFCGFEEDRESFSMSILHELIDFTLLANELWMYFREILHRVKTTKV